MKEKTNSQENKQFQCIKRVTGEINRVLRYKVEARGT